VPSPERVRTLDQLFAPQVVVAESHDGPAGLSHSTFANSVSLLALGVVVRWAVDIDGEIFIVVSEIRTCALRGKETLSI
jgi:hypothetical protein